MNYSSPVTLDANGLAQLPGGYGWRLTPGGTNPDSFPVKVSLNNSPSQLYIADSTAFYDQERFDSITIHGTPNTTWIAQIFKKGQVAGPTPQTAKQLFLSNLVANGSILTVVPTDGDQTKGYLIGTAWRSIRFTALDLGAGATVTVTKYVLTAGSLKWRAAGTWTVVQGTEEVFEEEVISPGGRIAYVCGTAIHFDLDLTVEV
jgi:hypothetical protein